MANNRMFLVHTPSGLAVSLGRRMGWGWYTVQTERIGEKIQLLFDTLEKDYGYEGGQDSFCLAMETRGGASSARVDWKYGPDRKDGLIQLKMNQSLLSGDDFVTPWNNDQRG